MGILLSIIAGLLLAAPSLAAPSLAGAAVAREASFSGACDASAGAMLTEDLFAAADDETNELRVYSLARGGAPVFRLAVSRFLRAEPRQPEADIEGAARAGEIIYWITSHARNKDGAARPGRQRLFATRIASVAPPRLEAFGAAYAGLLEDLEKAPQLAAFALQQAAALSPKEKHALNIEGLCARPDGSLLIGFRNPVWHKQALLVPLLNPAEVVRGDGTRARLGEPVRLDLGGRGVRDMVQKEGVFYLLAGSFDGGGRSELYRWDGRSAPALLHRWDKGALNPEAILALPGPSELLVLSDDSSSRVAGRPCQDVPQGSRRFRAAVVRLDAP